MKLYVLFLGMSTIYTLLKLNLDRSFIILITNGILTDKQLL